MNTDVSVVYTIYGEFYKYVQSVLNNWQVVSIVVWGFVRAELAVD